MYDWPETRAAVDARWALLRDLLRARGLDAPDFLVRRNADMPAVPGGIREEGGTVIAPDPAMLPPDDLDLQTLWRHPQLLLGQTCWGPMELGLKHQVQLVGQPDYSDVEGGRGPLYSSAIVMRHPARDGGSVSAPADGSPRIPLDLLRGRRLAFNSHDSMSGLTAITRDVAALGETGAFWSDTIESGGHRQSLRAVAEGRADVAAIDCRSWALAQRFEPASAEVRVVGWTAQRTGLPFIASKQVPATLLAIVRLTCAGFHP